MNRENFGLMTPLLFEVCSGELNARHCLMPIRAFLRTTVFVEAAVQGIDLERRVVHLTAETQAGELAYDQVVIALGAMTNRSMLPGSEHAFRFKTGQLFKLRMRGFLAWFVRRSYYLLQVPRWRRRLRIMIDWTLPSYFAATSSRSAWRARRPSSCTMRRTAEHLEQGAPRTIMHAGGRQFTNGEGV
jgi:NADH dehydrogenase FAD-containing subunit